jgi:hypothetical protein
VVIQRVLTSQLSHLRDYIPHDEIASPEIA